MTEKSDLSPQAWDAHTRKFRDVAGGSWRSYCDELHVRLIEEWIPRLGRTVLKTDLFDEAIGDGVLSRIAVDSVKLGVDISPAVVEDATRRQQSIQSMVADVRHLPISGDSVDSVISNSSLDHFETNGDIFRSLEEVHRVLRVDGRLLITLDNPVCPVIALRRLLPYRLLHRIGILPYPVGKTLSLRQLRRELVRFGFEIERVGTIMHVPRVLAIPLCRRRDRALGGPDERLVERMLGMERMRWLPTRQMTGHFVAVLARKS